MSANYAILHGFALHNVATTYAVTVDTVQLIHHVLDGADSLSHYSIKAVYSLLWASLQCYGSSRFEAHTSNDLQARQISGRRERHLTHLSISRLGFTEILSYFYPSFGEVRAVVFFESPFNWGLPALPHKKDARESGVTCS
eukprot:scaffold14249_cov105-Skeletonema_dohrnii-CCMP3373.AAC.1